MFNDKMFTEKELLRRYITRRKDEPVWKTIEDKGKAAIRSRNQRLKNYERIEKHEASRGVKTKVAKKMK